MSGTKGEPDAVTAALRAALDEAFGARVERVVLFGSRARGEHEPDSDYDVLVLVDKRTDELDERIRDVAWNVGWERDALVFVLVCETARFEEARYEPLFRNIRAEGVTL